MSDNVPRSVVHRPVAHESAVGHVTGTARYVDDIPEPAGTLHVALGLSPKARGGIARLDLARVRWAEGVVAVLTAADIPGANEVSPSIGGDPMLADGAVAFHGQVIFAVVAASRHAARAAARLATIEIATEPPVVDVAAARLEGGRVLPDYTFLHGDPEARLADAPSTLTGGIAIGGQEHFYLEGQVALAVPGEGGMQVFSSTQYPSEVQHIVAHVLGQLEHAVTVECRRMGGGFGGKESQASQWAAIAALAAHHTGRPCKLRLDRDDDFVVTGKRHDFLADWVIGHDADGRIAGLKLDLDARCGYSADLSLGVVDRSMFHADNAYSLPAARITSRRLKTNTVSNTAFRGFGGPQGMLATESAVEAIARSLGRDPLDVRKLNAYRPGSDTTPYGMRVADCGILLPVIEQLEVSSDYRARRQEVDGWNASAPLLRRGIALTPVKFGISFTLPHLNQAGALVLVYADGSVQLNHGGTEMGQGLYVKVAQVVAEEFGIALDRVRVTATATDKVPNAPPTAASAGSDLNGMAARNAARAIKVRMAAVAAEKLQLREEAITFRGGEVGADGVVMSFNELARQCVLQRVSLAATGFYATPGITWDRQTQTGNPFFYFAYGAACSEVTIDTLTGEMRLDRVDILHDCGSSLNPAIDRGQIEGGFVQGLGWLTTEELVFAPDGRLLTHAPSTYKIPVAGDVPEDFRVDLYDRPNDAETIYRSKAVGEPPVMLALSAFFAIADAVHSVRPGRPVRLDAPATPEAILRAVDRQRGEA